MTPEEYDAKIKEMEAKAQADRQAIIQEWEERKTSEEGMKEDARMILVTNSEHAARRIVDIATARVTDHKGDGPSFSTQLKAASLVYQLAILDTKAEDADGTNALIDRLMNPPTADEAPRARKRKPSPRKGSTRNAPESSI